MTKPQLQSLHILRRQLTTATHGHFDEAEFRIVLRSLGRVRAAADGHVSSTRLDNVGFEAVMAFLEEQLAHFDASVGTRWRDVDDRRRAGLLSRRQEWEIARAYEQLVAADVPYTLASVARQMSGGRTSDVERLSPHEASNVIEMLHAVAGRQKVGA